MKPINSAFAPAASTFLKNHEKFYSETSPVAWPGAAQTGATGRMFCNKPWSSGNLKI